MSRKLRVLFPYTEAGYGHIMPMRAVENAFRKKYGDLYEIVSSPFFTETNDPHLKNYEQMMANQVRHYSRDPRYGYLTTTMNNILGTKLSAFVAVDLVAPIATRHGVRHMEDLAPDVVFSTHWVTDIYARKIKKDRRPATVMYVPDARVNKIFAYPADLLMISSEEGYRTAIREFRRLNEDNFRRVPFPIREEAFSIPTDKRQNRLDLGLDPDRFTVVFAEGGYGVGKTLPTVKLLVKERFPLNVIAVCGKNHDSFEELSALRSTSDVRLTVRGFADDMLKLIASADLFCGKSGNIIAEPTFFGVPSVITSFATEIEQHIAEHYMEGGIGCAVREFEPEKIVERIRNYAAHPDLLEPLRKNALACHGDFGAEKIADAIHEICLGRAKNKE